MRQRTGRRLAWAGATIAALALVVAPAASADKASKAGERTGLYRRNARKLTLVGTAITVGKKAPSTPLRTTKLKKTKVKFNDGKVRIVYTLPSVDTKTCSVSTREFNQRASNLGKDVEVVVVSRDLPYAHDRFCEGNGIKRVITLSDYESGAFGRAWGVYVKETGLLARSVAVVDHRGVVRYQQIVANETDQPNYDKPLKLAKEIRGWKKARKKK